MKAIITVITWCLVSPMLNGEALTIYEGKKKAHTIAHQCESQKHEIGIHVWSIGRKMGVIQIGEFENFFKRVREHDASNEPFLALGYDVIAKTEEGQYYYIFIENHKDNPKLLRGKRATISHLANLGDKDKPVLVYGTGGGGYFFTKSILKDLSLLTSNTASGDTQTIDPE